ncbi:MAG: hypothetical protein A4S09_13975 [Proteobacteria bacterium SG_bin7]|nr:MAG: hypothetical protein A4S09_13975 [Proteobacteria bacterium SG_bin7]
MKSLRKYIIYSISAIMLAGSLSGKVHADSTLMTDELLTEEEKSEELPVTDTDRMVIDIFKGRQKLISRKKLVLEDIAQYISTKPALKEKWGQDNQLMSLFHEDLWPIILGGGYAVRNFFQMLKSYHDANPTDDRVIYNRVGRGQIEYYAVPNSYVYVSRAVPNGVDDISTYAMVTRSPDIWRVSFSIHKPTDSDVTSSFGVDKRFAQDILHIIKSVQPEAVEIKEDWSTYSHLVKITAKKLYETKVKTKWFFGLF